jgi:hypothetical protein
LLYHVAASFGRHLPPRVESCAVACMLLHKEWPTVWEAATVTVFSPKQDGRQPALEHAGRLSCMRRLYMTAQSDNARYGASVGGAIWRVVSFVHCVLLLPHAKPAAEYLH